jgi:hypothetical protein
VTSIISANVRRELLSRWLYNVNVVKTWKDDHRRRRPLRWWIPHSTRSVSVGGIQASHVNGPVDNPFQLGSFIGQGRRLQACCLSSVLMDVGDTLHLGQRGNPAEYNTSAPYDEGGNEVLKRLSARPPNSWYKIAFVGLLIVWTSITMALLLAYNTPTIGLGCWSGSFLTFGILSSSTWMLQFIRPQRPVGAIVKICTFFNLVSMGWLITVVFLMVSLKALDREAPSDSTRGHRCHEYLLVQLIASISNIWRLCQS